MILASAIDISINLLMVVHVVISLLLILVVLMQRPKQEGLGAAFGGGVMDSFAGAGTTSFLQKTTVYMGSIFIILSLALAILIGNRNDQRGMEPTPKPEVSATTAPEIPIPVLPVPSLKDELEVEGETPVEPVTPTDDPVVPAEPETPADSDTPADAEAGAAAGAVIGEPETETEVPAEEAPVEETEETESP
jgi:preprotein translocase subunit SecG